MSSTLTLASGARRIWNMRINGKKPNEPVFITAVGPLNSGTFQVDIDTSGPAPTTYDWRWVIDLSVCIVYENASNHRFLSKLAREVLARSPNGGYMQPFRPGFGYLWMWNVDKQDGSLISYWRGHEGVPLLHIPAERESFTVQPMMRLDKHVFVVLDKEAA